MPRYVRWVALGGGLAVLVALFVLLRPDPDPTATSSPTATDSPTSSPTSTDSPTRTSASPQPSPTDDVREVEIEVEDGRVRGPGTVRVTRGERVRFVVETDVADEIHLHGYDVKRDVAPGAPAVLELVADVTGIFEMELEHAGLLLTRLEVTP